MNAVFHRLLKFTAVARTVALAGFTALAGSSCVSYPPPGPDGNVFVEGNERPRFGYGGSQSPNNNPGSGADPSRRADVRKPPVIKRDPSDTTIDMTPPEPRLERTPEPSVITPPSETVTPSNTTTTPPPVEPAPPAREDLPTGQPIVGKKGFVYSPYATGMEVDVRDIPAGKKVKCPYTGKIFRVP